MRYAFALSVLWVLLVGFAVERWLPRVECFVQEIRAVARDGFLDVAADPGSDHAAFKNDVTTPAGLVVPLTGGLSYVKRDLETEDDGPGVVFARTYNSLDTRVTPLGPGWTYNYDIRIDDPGDGSGRLVLVGPQGRSDVHQRRPDGTFQPPPEVGMTLAAQPDGTYVATHADGLRWYFRRDGKLERIVDPGGRVTALEYDAAGHLMKNADPAGCGSLQLGYDSDTNRLTSVTDWMSPPRTIRYGDDDHGKPTAFQLIRSPATA